MTDDLNLTPPENLRSRMLSGGAWVLFGKTITVLCTLANDALLTRILGEDGYGTYVAAFSLVSVAAVAGQLGLHQAAVRFIASSMGLQQPGRARETLRLIFRWAVIGGLGVFLLLVSGLGGYLVVRYWQAPELAASMGTVAVWAVLVSFQVITSECFRGFKDLRFAALFGGAITGIINVGLLTVIFFGGGKTPIAVILQVVVIAAALSLGVGLVVLYRLHGSALPIDRGSLTTGELFHTAAPLWAIIVVNTLLAHADRWILLAFLPKAEVGYYGVAARLVMVVSQSLILINLLVPPYIAELYAKGEKQRLERILRQTAALAAIPALAVLLVFVFAGGPLLGLFYPDSYRAAAGILAILSVSKLVNVLTGSSGITMAMTGHQHILMRIAVVTSGLSIVTCYFMVQRWGAVGVAATVSIGSSLVFIFQWLATKKYTGMWTHPSIPRVADIRKLFTGS